MKPWFDSKNTSELSDELTDANQRILHTFYGDVRRISEKLMMLV
jgi:hypothetical protein